MATPAEIEAVKDQLPEDAGEYGWDDDRIGEALDSGLTGNSLLLAFWDKVSVSTADLTDMSESGSSRSLSQIHKNALGMAKLYRDLVDKEVNPPATKQVGIKSRPIRRV